MRPHASRGFTLIELLLVLAIIGIISGIAIPALTGQRQRARIIGDAQTNASVLAMGIEAAKAENGTYGPAGATATWTPLTTTPALTGFTANPVPGFSIKGNSQMSFVLTVQPFTYTIDAHSGTPSGTLVLTLDQTGNKTVYQQN